MAARVAGALLVLIAAALLALSVVATPWWRGHPWYQGAEIKAKEYVISPFAAKGCNTGGDGACMNVPVDATFETIGFALTGVVGLLTILALALALFAFQGAARAKSFGVFVIVGAMIAAGLAVVLVLIGPQVRTEAALPFSIGLYLFFGGIAAAIAGSAIAMRVHPTPHQPRQLAPPRQSQREMQHSPGLNVKELIGEADVRPSSLGPEPRLGRGSPVASPGGALPGPSGPLGAIAPSGGQPLFSSAPNLRPLYDAAPQQGGTDGFVPKPEVRVPMRPPTPVPRDQISAHAGIPTPASIQAERPITFATKGAPPPPPTTKPTTIPPPLAPLTPNPETDRDLLGTGHKPKTVPPPARGAVIKEAIKASTIAPIPPLVKSPPLGRATPGAAGMKSMPPTSTLATSSPPPPPNTTLADDEPFDAMKTYQREESRPPTPKRESTKRPATPRPPTRLATEDGALDTDVSTVAIDETAQPTESFETATNESTSFAPKPRAPSISATMETAPAPPDDDVLSASMPKLATDMDLPTVRPPTETAPSPPAPQPVVAITPAVEEGPTDREKAKPPISTAPTSLPPPSAQQQATSGPSPACPQCEAPMAWVEAHLRFYCKSCKMYF